MSLPFVLFIFGFFISCWHIIWLISLLYHSWKSSSTVILWPTSPITLGAISAKRWWCTTSIAYSCWNIPLSLRSKRLNRSRIGLTLLSRMTSWHRRSWIISRLRLLWILILIILTYWFTILLIIRRWRIIPLWLPTSLRILSIILWFNLLSKLIKLTSIIILIRWLINFWLSWWIYCRMNIGLGSSYMRRSIILLSIHINEI